MRSIFQPLGLFVLTLIAMSPSYSQADTLCTKAKLANGKVKLKVQTVGDTESCPKGYTNFVNTSKFVGPQGPAGSPGAAGATGSISSTLPSGQTLRGVWGGFVSVSAGGQYLTDTQTFASSLPSSVPAHFVLEGSQPIAECPGTATAPEALAGHLCIYETSHFNRTLKDIFDTAHPGPVQMVGGKYGFTIYFQSINNTGGYVASYGTYAVRAP